MKLLAIFCHHALAAIVFLTSQATAHGELKSISSFSHVPGAITFPDVGEFITLSSDLHTHSVFSDGHVWPSIRVQEALLEGLDILAITEHLEWQPHLGDIPHPDRNRAYEIAKESAEKKSVLVIAGAEITRELPVGHVNAIFVKDSNALFNSNPKEARDIDFKKIVDQYVDSDLDLNSIEYYARAGMYPATKAIEEANSQGAFVFWNHPSWAPQAPDGIPRLSELHLQWLREGQLHGIEVVNGDRYSQKAFDLALYHDLTLIGTSDVHELIHWDYSRVLNEHRPVTLIFSKSRKISAVKDALIDKRTVVWFKDTLIGRKEYLKPLIMKSIKVENAVYVPGSSILNVTLRNISSAVLEVSEKNGYRFHNQARTLRLPGKSVGKLQIALDERKTFVEVPVEIKNALITPEETLEITLNIKSE